MSKPKPHFAQFSLDHDGTTVIVTFIFDRGKHSLVRVNRAGVAVTIDNRRGEYKPRVTDAMRLVEQAANGASPIYRGRQRASRAATTPRPGKVPAARPFGIFRGQQ